MKKLIIGLSFLALTALFTGCQNPQEDEGISPLPQNRPSAAEMKMGGGIPISY